MALEIEFNNLVRSPIRRSFLEKMARLTLKNCGLAFLAKKRLKMSVVSVGVEEIRKLNKIYRKINSATDCLSFSEYRSQIQLEKNGDKEAFMGEVVLCYNNIEDYCRKKKINPEEELARVFAHGILHLLAFRHGKKMFGIQDKAARDFADEIKR